MSGYQFARHGLWLVRLLTPVTGKLTFITDLFSEHNISVMFNVDLNISSAAAFLSGSCIFFYASYTIGSADGVNVLFADSRSLFLLLLTSTQL